MSVEYTVKRSVSPDGKIDSVSVETRFAADAPDTQAVLDAIAESNKYATFVATLAPAPKTYTQTDTVTPSASGPTGTQTLTGTVQAVYAGEKSATSGKTGPGAIIIDGVKVKTFDKKLIEAANNLKNNGLTAKATFVRDEKWKSNDLKTIEAVTG